MAGFHFFLPQKRGKRKKNSLSRLLGWFVGWRTKSTSVTVVQFTVLTVTKGRRRGHQLFSSLTVSSWRSQLNLLQASSTLKMSAPPHGPTEGAAENKRMDASSSVDDRRNSQEPSAASTSTQTNWRVSLPNVISNLFQSASPSSQQQLNEGASSASSPAAASSSAQQTSSAVTMPLEAEDQDVSMTDASLLTALADQASASTPAHVPVAAAGSNAATSSTTATMAKPAAGNKRRPVAGGRKSGAAAAARVGEKRTMPSRLRRVSSLLGGTGVGEALKDHQQRLGAFLPLLLRPSNAYADALCSHLQHTRTTSSPVRHQS